MLFNGQNVTDDNIKKIADDVLRDPLLVKTLLLYDVPGERPESRKYKKDNAFRIVYFFISLVEYLDRTEGLSYGAFTSYSSKAYREAFGSDFDSHVNRCRAVETGKHDFLVRAALAHEHKVSDVFFVSMMLAHLEEDSYNALLGHCKAALSVKDRQGAKQKITDDDLRKISEGFMRMGLANTEQQGKNMPVVVLLFLSIVEYLNRSGELTFGRFADYSEQLVHEGNIGEHLQRCRQVAVDGDCLGDTAARLSVEENTEDILPVIGRIGDAWLTFKCVLDDCCDALHKERYV